MVWLMEVLSQSPADLIIFISFHLRRIIFKDHWAIWILERCNTNRLCIHGKNVSHLNVKVDFIDRFVFITAILQASEVKSGDVSI